jgi:hypothetical protein
MGCKVHLLELVEMACRAHLQALQLQLQLAGKGSRVHRRQRPLSMAMAAATAMMNSVTLNRNSVYLINLTRT